MCTVLWKQFLRAVTSKYAHSFVRNFWLSDSSIIFISMLVGAVFIRWWFQDIPRSKISQIFPVSKMHNFEFEEFHNTLRLKISKIIRVSNSSTILPFEVYHKISSLKISTIFCAKLFFFDHNTYNFSALPRGCLILFLPPFSRDPQCAPPPSRKMNAPLVGM